MSEEIKVSDKKLKLPGNLTDYQQARSEFSWDKARKEITYYEGGKFNSAHEILEKWAEADPSRIALDWTSAKGENRLISYEEMNKLANKLANYLKKLGIEQGDRVFFFAPRVPAVYWGYVGCLKIGALTGTLFGAYQEDALRDRLADAQPKVIITGRELVDRIEKIKGDLTELKEVLIVEDLENVLASESDDFMTARLSPETPSFMMYTSGTEGYIDSVVHAHEAVIQQKKTAEWVLDLKEEDVYWCSADPGWVTGVVYSMTTNFMIGVKTVVYEGRFDADAWYKLMQDKKVSVWYTAPTALRMLMGEGDEVAAKYDLSSLRHVCTVGEPLNPEVIRWARRVLGVVLHDTWWQTEIGAITIANYPEVDIRLGSMGKPTPGMEAAILDENLRELPKGTPGRLALKTPWPSMMRQIWQRPERYQEFFKGEWYVTNDEVMEDEDGYFWFVGRDDEIIKTSGERVGSFEVESALVEHPAVVEAGVVGKPDKVRGQIIKAFLVLKPGVEETDKLKEEIAESVKKNLAGHAYPREIQVVKELPKTKSGKIIRKELLSLEK